MRHCFEDSCNMKYTELKIVSKNCFYKETNWNTQIIYFKFKDFYVPF